MAGFRRSRTPEVTAPPHKAATSLVASAARVNLEGQAWRTYRFGNDEWQSEAWRLYDIVGELRFAANWVGSACSRVRIYVAEVDKNGRVQQETTDPKVAAIADTVLGGPSSKAEALRLAGINLTVAGDFYIVGRGAKNDDDPDKWFIVSCSELRRWGGNIAYIYPDGSKEYLDPNSDLVIRVWTPHPRRNIWADSPTRAALPMLWEIERLTRYVFAQIDSRLVSAGLLPIPQEISFPDDDSDEDGRLTGAEGLTAKLLRTGSASLKGEGTAAGVVPTIMEVPLDALGKIQLVNFASELSRQALDLRQEAVRRFALAMDMAPEILLGTGDVSHWGAWHVSAENVKVHIEPIMTRICEALSMTYLTPALKAIKKDPDRYTFAYDTAPLVVRPQRLQDTLNLQEKGIVSNEAVLIAGDYKLSDAPSDEEDLKRFTRELMLRDPNLFQIAKLREVAGYTQAILPADTVVTPQNAGAGPPAPPVPPTGIQETVPPPMPANSTAANALAGPGQNASTPVEARTASAVPHPVTTFVVANAAALRALEVAGKRLLDPTTRGQYPSTPPHELHTKIRVKGVAHAQKLLHGAWDHLSVLTDNLGMTVDSNALRNTLESYCTLTLASGVEHDPNALGEALRTRGFLDAQP